MFSNETILPDGHWHVDNWRCLQLNPRILRGVNAPRVVMFVHPKSPSTYIANMMRIIMMSKKTRGSTHIVKDSTRHGSARCIAS